MGENVGLNYRNWFLQKGDRNYFQRGAFRLQASGRYTFKPIFLPD
ncbi:hypothetical protein VitviT2T_026355 [Vitis vinifera]|uniref:Uncharacterized protein n=1 Tax=Vitis vinifera TaxID=29760 RepID=A0ABY9DMS7_VITVI|nr:hypothetical protein VitviT2T_026355 [Vitis vinifera]